MASWATTRFPIYVKVYSSDRQDCVVVESLSFTREVCDLSKQRNMSLGSLICEYSETTFKNKPYEADFCEAMKVVLSSLEKHPKEHDQLIQDLSLAQCDSLLKLVSKSELKGLATVDEVPQHCRYTLLSPQQSIILTALATKEIFEAYKKDQPFIRATAISTIRKFVTSQLPRLVTFAIEPDKAKKGFESLLSKLDAICDDVVDNVVFRAVGMERMLEDTCQDVGIRTMMDFPTYCASITDAYFEKSDGTPITCMGTRVMKLAGTHVFLDLTDTEMCCSTACLMPRPLIYGLMNGAAEAELLLVAKHYEVEEMYLRLDLEESKRQLGFMLVKTIMTALMSCLRLKV